MLGLVSYSGSESESDDSEESHSKYDIQETEESSRKKRKFSSGSDEETCQSQKLPLPKLFGNTLVKSVRDKNGKHKGRKRTFDHFEGNWPTYIYIPVKDSPNFKIVYDQTIKSLTRQYSSTVHTYPLNMCHISISRTVPIRHYWITPIFDKLKELFSGKEKFYYTLHSIQVYTNDEKTRTFIGFDVSTGHNTFVNLVEKTDKIFKEFDLEKYYQSPSFHASIAWVLGDKKEEIESYFRCNGGCIISGFSSGLSHH